MASSPQLPQSSSPSPSPSPQPQLQLQTPSSKSGNSPVHAGASVGPANESENNDVLDDVVEEKPEIRKFQLLDSKEYVEKCKRYEADYTRRLMAKYFSNKNTFGGDIFSEKMVIDGETIMSSRWPCMRTFADPVKALEEQNNGSASTSMS